MKRIVETYNKIRSYVIDAMTSGGPYYFFFYDPDLKIKGVKWRIHKDDVDTWPSIPHLHSLEKSWKLDAYTGRIYDIKTKKHIHTANSKIMSKLWSDKKFVSIVIGYRERYGDKYNFPPLPSFATDSVSQNTDDCDVQYETYF